MKIFFLVAMLFSFSVQVFAQLKWQNVDSLYQPLPGSVHVFKTTDSMFDGKPNIAYYVIADLKDKHLLFDADTTYKRRLTPSQFYEKNKQPLLVVNCTFFSFETNQNLNVVIDDSRLVGYNIHTINGRGKDTFTYRHPFGSAIGIDKKGNADIAWVYSDSFAKRPLASQHPVEAYKDSATTINSKFVKTYRAKYDGHLHEKISLHAPKGFLKWKMQSAIGGGPVLLQEGEIKITNNEEIKFAGKAINDKHPRTAMGYTKDNKLIILVVQGRFPMIAEGATLNQEAQILKDLGCWEALNLDGGGSSCMLVNGKTTIKPSSEGVQRPVPAVFTIKIK
ncbi:MAG: phosphodiester glycosidase family protein [Bacteroidetes bacterium]|nr:MAG: phosphodiester glycosidase family protein [Bacteroidota bacterium]